MTQRMIPGTVCTQLDKERMKRKEGAFCRVTHRAAYPGDHGVRWTPEAGFEHFFDGINVEDEPFPVSPLGN